MWSVAVLLHHFFNLYFLCHRNSDNHMSTFASDKYFGVLLYRGEGTKGKVTVGRKGQSTVFCTIHVIISMASVCHVEFVMQDIGNMITLGFCLLFFVISVNLYTCHEGVISVNLLVSFSVLGKSSFWSILPCITTELHEVQFKLQLFL